MKIRDGFILRKILSEYIVLPINECKNDLNGIIALNEVGAFIWQKLEASSKEEEILDAILTEYEVSLEKARKDLSKFLKLLGEANLIE